MYPNKVLIGVNVLDSVQAAPYMAHSIFWGWTKQHYPDTKFFFYAPERVSIDRMRNEAAKMALEMECDYLMFIDDDVVIEANTFDSLLKCNADIAMAETYIRSYPFDCMFFKHTGKKLAAYNDYKADENGLVEVDALGFSCVLIKCELLKKVSTPYFVTAPNHTEDIYFCLKAVGELGAENVRMVVDTKVPTMHQMPPDYVGRENVALLREYHRKLHEKLGISQEKKADRGEDYLDSVTNLFINDEEVTLA